ncbi:MAG: sensor histidine kinase [Planctomycetota bacterium]
MLYELGFEAAIEWLAEELESQHGLPVRVARGGGLVRMGEELGVLLFEAVRELLLNVVKHAEATAARVRIGAEDGAVHITVEDDGVGFNVPEVREHRHSSGGFGLFNIRERLDQLGGRLEVHSELGRGTRAVLVAPMNMGN